MLLPLPHNVSACLLSQSQETCSKTESVLGPVKEAFKAAEQSTYEYLSHFSEGLREDVREVRSNERQPPCCPLLPRTKGWGSS